MATEKERDNCEKADSKKSLWPSASEAMDMLMKLAKDVKKSGEEIYEEYKSKREGTGSGSGKSKNDDE